MSVPVPVSPVRTLTAASRLVGLCLLSVTCVTSTEARRGTTTGGRTARAVTTACDQHTTTLPTLRRHFPSLGPVATSGATSGATRKRRTRNLLLDVTPRVQRGAHRQLHPTDDAIQNDSPVARLEGDERQDPAFRQFGLLGNSVDRLPVAARCSRRSPRGPPTVI